MKEPNTVKIRMGAAAWTIAVNHGGTLTQIDMRMLDAAQQRQCIFEVVKHVRIQRDAA